MTTTQSAVAVPTNAKQTQTGWVEVVRIADEANLTAQQVADLLRYGISGEGVPIPGPEPTIPELSSQQTRAAVYRTAVRLISGGQSETDDLDAALLLALEAKLISRRAELEGLPHIAVEIDRCCVLHPITLAAINMLVKKVVAAAPPLPPLVVTAKKR